ncbi:MAG: tetratricopeptide repeat protein [Oligoflexales bacterium]|nr:tetratricopeptide repeat protein [Oligoflexales bacterium]
MNKMFYIPLALVMLLAVTSCTTTSWFQSSEGKKLDVFASDETRIALKYARLQGSIEDAVSKLRGLIRKKPKELRYRLTLARLYLIKGKTGLAEKQAKIVEKFQYRNLQAKIILANVAFMKGFNEKSKLILNSLGKLQKMSLSAKTEVLNLLAGVALRQGNDQESIDLLKQSLKINPRYPSSHMNLGLIYLKHQEYRLAIVHFRSILKVLPGNDVAQLHLGICYAGIGNYDKAEDLYDLVLKKNPDQHTLYFNRAVLEYRRKDYRKSIDYLREYIDKAPSKYLAKKAAMEIINEIQLANVKSSGISDSDIMDLSDRIQDSGQHSSASEPISFDRASELNVGFVFTSVGYVND